MGKKFRILSINGGGLRGIIPVLVLEELEKRTGKRIHEMFDMIAGTSTGGMIACALALGDANSKPRFTIEDIKKTYMTKGNLIFPHKTGILKFFSNIHALIYPEYSEKGIASVLKEMMGESRITDCLIPIYIPAYDLNHNIGIFFNSRRATADAGQNAMLYNVCRATSAGPTYLNTFPFFYNGRPCLFVDGGVFMNNPSTGAIVEVSKHSSEAPYNRPDLDFKDICMLSLGTGHYEADIAKKIKNGGLLNWAQPITDVMMQGSNETITMEAEELLEDNQFLRIKIVIKNKKHSDMADSTAATRDYLINATKEQVISNASVMKELDDFIKKAELI